MAGVLGNPETPASELRHVLETTSRQLLRSAQKPCLRTFHKRSIVELCIFVQDGVVSQSPENGRIIGIDTLRGLAATAVVLFHLNEPAQSSFDPSVYKTLVSHGWLGVAAFFVISGLSIQASAGRASSVADYARKRFWRIYPPYLASVAIVLACVAYRKISMGTNDLVALPKSLSGVLATLSLTTNPVSDHWAINWVYWSLSYEVAFYLLLGLTVLSVRLRWPLLIGLTLGACYVGQHPPRTLFFLNQWSFFALGASLALWRMQGGVRPLLLATACLLDFYLNQRTAAAITAVVTVLLCAACLRFRNILLNRETIMSQVGEWSYGLYLIHVPIGCWLLLGLFAHVRSSSQLERIAGDVAILIICIAASGIFYRVIEAPFMTRLRPGKLKTLASAPVARL